jgi:predicted porin
MKKTIIAASIAAVVAAPAAFADVSVYGKAHIAMSQVNNGGTTADVDSIDSRASRFGIKSVEDLGNGMKMTAVAEFEHNAMDQTATAGASINARDSYVALSGDFGTVAAGRMAAPTKAVLYGIGNVQLADANKKNDFAQGFKSKGNINGGTQAVTNAGRTSNAIAYKNSFNGVNVAIATVGNDSNDNMASTSFAISGDIAGAHVGLAQTDVDGVQKTTIVGAKMSFGALTAGLVYEDVKSDTASSDLDTTGLSLSYTMGANVLSASMSERDGDTASLKEDRYNLGLEHKLSKKSSVYVSYADVDADGVNSDKETVSIGMVHNF